MSLFLSGRPSKLGLLIIPLRGGHSRRLDGSLRLPPAPSSSSEIIIIIIIIHRPL